MMLKIRHSAGHGLRFQGIVGGILTQEVAQAEHKVFSQRACGGGFGTVLMGRSSGVAQGCGGLPPDAVLGSLDEGGSLRASYVFRREGFATTNV